MPTSRETDIDAMPRPTHRPAVRIVGRDASADIPDVARVALCTACLVAFIDHTPLVDLRDQALLNASNAGSVGTQLVFGGLGLAMAAALWQLGFGRLRVLASTPLLLCAGWLGLTILTSADPVVSIRRLALLAIAALMAAGVLVVARSVRQFALALTITSGIILVSSYLTILFLPDLGIHSGAYDLIMEPEHDGLWRGIFAHKNEAGAGMALLAITGLFVASVYSRLSGILIAVAATAFLLQTNSKTVLALMPMVVVATSLCRVFTGPWTRAALLAGPAAAISLASLGATFVPALRDALSVVMSDTSFTGRSELWEFAVTQILQRPVFGWGYGAFWGSERTLFGMANLDWFNTALQAHNGFLDAALAMGLPGLAFTLVAFVISPLRDLQRAAPGREIDATTLYFLRIWLLALCTASFETVLYAANLALGCLLLVALFGLRLRAAHGLSER